LKTQYYAAASLDGFIATPDHALDWLFQFGDVEDTSYPAFIREVGALAMGSATYEWILRHQVQPDSDRPGPWPYEQPAWVFSSRSLPPVPGADIRFVSGDVRPVHRDMVAAAGGGNVWIVGGGELAGQFCEHGLLDELIVQVAPVTLGTGKPLLPRRIVTPPLRLMSSTVYGLFVELRYELPRRTES
jgi:dihydrofolate reductase